MPRPIPDSAVTFVKKTEALRLKGYLCPTGHPTNGWGHTGPDVKVGVLISRARAEANLADDLRKAAMAIDGAIGERRANELTEGQYAALLSFVFNLGISGKTIWNLLRAGKFSAVPGQLILFTHGRVNGKMEELPGLVNRRKAEAILWNGGSLEDAIAVATGGAAPLPSSTTRLMDTPPQPSPDAKPLVQSKTVWTGAVTAGVGVLSGLKDQVQPLLNAQAAHSPLAAHLNETVATAIVVLGLTVIAIRALDERARRQ